MSIDVSGKKKKKKKKTVEKVNLFSKKDLLNKLQNIRQPTQVTEKDWERIQVHVADQRVQKRVSPASFCFQKKLINLAGHNKVWNLVGLCLQNWQSKNHDYPSRKRSTSLISSPTPG